MDLFANPIMTLLAKNLSFIAGSLLAILLVFTVIQEQLLTTNHVLTVITVLGERGGARGRGRGRKRGGGEGGGEGGRGEGEEDGWGESKEKEGRKLGGHFTC